MRWLLESEVAAVRNAVMLEADLAGAVRRAFAGTLGEARMRLFHPLGFMLASPVESPEEAVERFAEKPSKQVQMQRQMQVLRLALRASLRMTLLWGAGEQEH